MTAKASALAQAQENIGNATAAMQEADSALAQIEDIILNMKQLAQQAMSDTIGPEERLAIDYELKQYAAEINDIAGDTNWQGVNLLTGSLDWSLQVGESEVDVIQFRLSASETESRGFDAVSLGISDLEVTSTENAAIVWASLNAAESIILGTEERIGSTINRMNLKNEALISAETNTRAAISRIQDTDIALAQMQLAQDNILQQIALAMLSQTEQAPSAFLNLFK
jgi:flagellin